MTSYQHANAKLARLKAAFPQFKPTAEATKIFLEKMLKLDATRLDSAIEWLIENHKYKSGPTIAEVVSRAVPRGENLPQEPGDAEPTSARSGKAWIANPIAGLTYSTGNERSELWRTNFDKGQRNAQEHMDRMLSDRNLYECPCLTCRERHAPRAEIVTSL